MQAMEPDEQDRQALPAEESPQQSPPQEAPAQEAIAQEVPAQESPSREPATQQQPALQEPPVPGPPAQESPTQTQPVLPPPASQERSSWQSPPAVPPPWQRPVQETTQLEPVPQEPQQQHRAPQGPPPQQPSWADSISLDSIPLGPPPPSAPETRSIPLGRSGETVYHTSAVYGGGAKHAQQPKKRRPPVAMMVTGGVVVAVVVALVLVLTVFKPGSSTPKYGLIPTGGSPQEDAQQVATAFLTAWQSGDLTKAANYTDAPASAQTALTAYAKDLNLGKFAASASGVTSASGSTAAQPRENVTFGVRASVAAGSGTNAQRGTWTYHSTLVAYQQPKSSVWFVKWQPDVVAPNLTSATHLATILVPPTVSMVTDASGGNLKQYGDPGLNIIAGLLAASPPVSEGAKYGLDVQIENKKGSPVANSQAPIIAPGNYPTISTTINAKAEAAARAAVGTHKQSSMIAIQPSTGQILAIANNAGQNDFALTAQVAPGSTMKVITSAALLNAGVLTPQTAVACPAAFTIQGITYHNDQGETLPPGTPFTTDFAQSCNNAFTTQWSHLSGKLASTAKDYFGLNQDWNIGIGNLSASYFNAPASASGSELAQ